ncbi:MAG: phosphoglycerate kinase [Candidatus Staskawiczbacteria bacterium]|nr:phosphoglycerate kinase [Candidatus Staskawiczbacteria bacterium]
MFKTVKEFNVLNKRVLVRCDFNVPLDKKGNILDDFRIKSALLTIKYLVENKAKIILMSHLGDPKGKKVSNLKLDNTAKRLGELLNAKITKDDDCVGPLVESHSKSLEGGEILLLENLRFHKEEEEGDNEFAKKLSWLGDIYVNDAFSASHRAHASIIGPPQFIPSFAGLLFLKEVENLNKALKNPARPLVVVVGGKKAETKSKFINKISESADLVIVSGLVKKEFIKNNIKLSHPEKIISPGGSLEALDIDRKTAEKFEEKIMLAKTVIWNGSFGKFEQYPYSKGTRAIANAILESGAFSVVGGGDTIEFLAKQGILEKFSHISTGGGAMLAYLAGEKMPGLEALR